MTTIAAFDLDGTLTRRDTFLPFLRRVCGTSAVATAVLSDAARVAGAAARLADRDAAKASLVRRLLAGRALRDLEDAGEHHADRLVARALRPDVVARLLWHQRRGHTVVLVSASLEVYARPFGEHLGVDATFATRLDVDGHGRCTGALSGANCRGPEKVRRLGALLAGGAELWAYGDSVDDRPLLAAADRPVVVTAAHLPAAPAARSATHRPLVRPA